jgi:cation:H+ antiporter
VSALDFSKFPLWVNLAVFGAAAACVWIAGSRLAGYAEEIARRTGLNRAFLGMLLLGVATSTPEIATSSTGAMLGNAQLVAGNLLGGVALQVANLAVIDWIVVRGALTYFAPQPILLFQGVMLLLLLALTLAGMAMGEPVSVLGVGLTPLVAVAGYLFTVRYSHKEEHAPRWRATHLPEPAHLSAKDSDQAYGQTGKRMLYAFVGVGALVIFAAGWTVAQVGDAVAGQTNLGANFVGVALMALSTSLPELSTSLAAARQGNHQMAVANILGTNCLTVALFFLADLFYRDGPILAALDQASLVTGALGMILTCVLLLGLLERRNRTVFGLGVDMAVVIVIYFSGLTVLYTMR